MAATDPVGTVGQEAAKLAGVLGEWLTDHVGATGPVDAQPCTSCPVCVARAAVTRPEVRHHLATAAESLLAALAAVVDKPARK